MDKDKNKDEDKVMEKDTCKSTSLDFPMFYYSMQLHYDFSQISDKPNHQSTNCQYTLLICQILQESYKEVVRKSKKEKSYEVDPPECPPSTIVVWTSMQFRPLVTYIPSTMTTLGSSLDWSVLTSGPAQPTNPMASYPMVELYHIHHNK